MTNNSGETVRVDRVAAAAGNVPTAALPPMTLKRWVARRKADIIAAVEGGLLTEFEALARYNISREEFAAWVCAYRRDGVPGLRVKCGATVRTQKQPAETSKR